MSSEEDKSHDISQLVYSLTNDRTLMFKLKPNSYLHFLKIIGRIRTLRHKATSKSKAYGLILDR